MDGGWVRPGALLAQAAVQGCKHTMGVLPLQLLCTNAVVVCRNAVAGIGAHSLYKISSRSVVAKQAGGQLTGLLRGRTACQGDCMLPRGAPC